jgi:predicted HTH domain antitoxin
MISFSFIESLLEAGERLFMLIDDSRLPHSSPRADRRRVPEGVKWPDTMQVTINLPEDILAALNGQWDNVPRRSLEAIAVEAYRTGALTESQIRRLLGFETRFQVHALLKEHQVPLRYTAADFEADLSAHRQLGILPSR